ncbi:FecR family protein [Maribellus maritimus]|uniref:FecR family protein n=1 Tax=Maribellus maritimus TaxID=2870838 RepID=UPI001EEA8964|nr:FecR domain-containing protein [Maribellus maritimus]MCG6189374.1 FecR domain-containing protein [Maribellus maritimus]
MILDKEYLKFLEDPKFIEWIYYPTSELDEYWKNYQETNFEQTPVLLKSVELCKTLCSNDKKLSSKEKHEILLNALNKYNRNSKKSSSLISISRISIPGIAKYAAVAMVFFSLGYFVFYKTNIVRNQLLTESTYVPENSSDAQLILSDGKNIAIESKESAVNYNEDRVVIDNDTIRADRNLSTNDVAAFNQIIIPYGKRSYLTLADGSEIWLNSGSRLLFPNVFNNEKREIFLEGEAYIKVKADKSRPFIVNTNELSVEALGTEFNVSSYRQDDIVRTVLAEGRVRIRKVNDLPFSKSIYLEPNQAASYNKTTQESTVKEVDINYHTSWKDGYFLFDGEELNRITKKLERFYDIKIAYENSVKGFIEISGKLILSDDCQTAIDNIASTASVEIQKINESKYIIK